jgi:hypothetical protein
MALADSESPISVLSYRGLSDDRTGFTIVRCRSPNRNSKHYRFTCTITSIPLCPKRRNHFVKKGTAYMDETIGYAGKSSKSSDWATIDGKAAADYTRPCHITTPPFHRNGLNTRKIHNRTHSQLQLQFWSSHSGHYVLCNVTPWSLADIYQNFGGKCFLHS